MFIMCVQMNIFVCLAILVLGSVAQDGTRQLVIVQSYCFVVYILRLVLDCTSDMCESQ